MESNICYMAAYFFVYSFLGWMLEVAYQAVSKGKIVNRGFLNGPVCPIYGCGVVAVLVILKPYSDNLFLLYLGGVAFSTIIELVGGWVLYKAFQMRWWDYSKEPYNLGGFVCLKFSLAWGVCIVLVDRAIHPLIEMNVKFFMDLFIGKIALLIVMASFLADCIVTIIMIMHLNRDLKRMNAISKEMRKFSDALSERIAVQSMESSVRIQEARIQSTLARYERGDELRKLKEKSAAAKNEREKELLALKKKLSAHAHFGYGRIYRAFPDLKHVQYNEELMQVVESVKGHLGEIKKNSRNE